MHNFNLDDVQKLDLLDILWEASLWLPPTEQKNKAASLYLDIAQQLGALNEEDKLKLKINMMIH